ncbi:MAG TPA: hypothetical protein VMU27_01660, partial [Candidatus Paceibacterota bacterium]|nr:hypothetical protein [Candidatus Paceibacterota bacterium]
MSTAARARIANIGAFACAAILIMGAYSLASGQTACPAGDHLATADDVAKGVATAVGASCVNTVMAQNLNGGCGFDPYPIINAFRANTGVILTPAVGSDGKQDGINPILACRVAQFLQYAKSQGHSLVITSGYRSAAYQTQICEGICGSSCCSPNMSNGCAKGGA